MSDLRFVRRRNPLHDLESGGGGRIKRHTYVMNGPTLRSRLAWIVALAAGCGGTTTAITAAPDVPNDPTVDPDADGGGGEASAADDARTSTSDGGATDAATDGRTGCAAVLAKYRADHGDASTCGADLSAEVACCFMETYPQETECPTFCAESCGAKGGCNIDYAYKQSYDTANASGGAVVCPPVAARVSCGSAGRRPAGLREHASGRLDLGAVRAFGGTMTTTRAVDPIAAWLASCARLEAASVVAFERLAAELRAFGAPESLADACEAAAEEEARHAAVTRRLAERGHAVVPTVIVDPACARPLVDLAIENMVEGCVRETYAAAMVLHMSQHAHDRELGDALASIAEDEARHAELAAAIATWIDGHLTIAERDRVERARRAAIAALAAELEARPSHELVTRAGVPDVDRARVLLGLLDRHVWRAAA